MQNALEEVTNELEMLLAKTKELESKYMGEILALEKVVNHSRKTIPEVVRRQDKKVEEVKEQLTKESIDSKVDAMLMEIDQKQKMLEHNPRQKLEIKVPEPVVQKKPPIPTANRVEKSSKPNIPTYIPPRNKNEVTGKITQTTIKTNTQKVFRPELLAGTKRSKSRQFVNSKNTEKREQKSQAKVEDKKSESIQRHQNLPKSSSVVAHKALSIALSKPALTSKEKVNGPKALLTFNKQLDETLEELLSKGHKNRKHILEKMIRECQNEERGHKKHEQISRRAFLKHMNNLAVSRNAINPVFTHKLTRSKWRYYPELFELGSILSRLQNQIGNLQNIRQYKLDPKQQYRIVQTAIKLSQLLGKIQQEKSSVPDQLDLSFSHADISQPVSQQSDDLQQLSELKLNQDLNRLLEQLSQSSELLKPQLRGLQVLTEVGIFKSKKSPIILMQQQYSQWKQYYFNQ